MTLEELKAAIDLVLDTYNARKKANPDGDPSVWEPIEISPEGKIYSGIDGREMTQAELLKLHPSGTFR